MKYWEMIVMALENIKANRLRSGLTMLGLIIGVMSVIMVVTLGQGGQARFASELEKMGANVFSVSLSNIGEGEYQKYEITMQDCRVIRDTVEEISSLVPIGVRSLSIEKGREKKTTIVIATDGDYASLGNLEIVRGRFFSSLDNRVFRRVIVLNQKLAEELFDSEASAVGQRVTVEGVPAVVCGVCRNESLFATLGGPAAYIPFSFSTCFGKSRFGTTQLQGRAVSPQKVKAAADRTVDILNKRHHTKKDEKIYNSVLMEQQLQAANKITGILTLILGAIAGISLLVGGIGIMNIMLVSVTERTREIGIRIAIGARRQDILVQFLIESSIISLLGGAAGLLLGMGASAILCAALKLPFILSLKMVSLAFLFSIAVGILCGMYPANRAARLDPIEALRYE